MSDLSVLYADYSLKAASLMREALQPLNIGAFYACETQEETLALAHRHRPQLVMVSLQLDGYQGIKTIRYLRAMSGQENTYFNQVPVLLGAKSLNRDAMRDAVLAGIEGVFRQPLNPDRLHRIITTVIKSPRRFVLEGDYFGPSRKKIPSENPAQAPQPENSNDPADASANDIHNDTQDEPAVANRRARASTARPINAGTTLRSARKATSISRPPAPRDRTALSGGAMLAEAPAPGGETARISLQDDDLLTVAADRTKAVPALEMRTATKAEKQPVRTEIGSPAAAANTARDTAPPKDDLGANDLSADEETLNDQTLDPDLIEVDIRDALQTHKMWVDTGGKEGQKISFAHADLRDEDLENIDLTRCVLPQACLRKANCEGAVFRRCDLTAADFTGANLKNAILATSRLSNARFADATLTGTVFLGADLAHASLRGAKLVNCDLSGCNLTQTDLRDADLSTVKGLFAEQIQRARINTNTRLPRDMALKTL
ncbi:pentapeptide repeat-containing protein [Thalassospira mesophila]|uniref:pentapeptide repeat-containing protein n=1 Tax=Thalassospira mesophila TaxID=1293891 RepID=UPI001302DB29|nr:pentapeptide repeat-containing protein [Thalassospira mesophila]